MAKLTIRTGGQSGVDRAALDVCRAMNIDYAGWCPRGGWAEDYPEPPGLLAVYPRLQETPSSDPDQRTAWNIRDSDATLILTPQHESITSPGTGFAKKCAELIFLRPFLEITLGAPDALDVTRSWIDDLAAVRHSTRLELGVGGPRESEAPGVYRAAYDFLWRLIGKDSEGSSTRERL
jgi:hypothetical protein